MMSETNGYATAKELFSVPKNRRFKDESVVGRKFRLRSLFANETAKWMSDNERKPMTMNERLIVQVVVDGEGNPVFSDADVTELSSLDAAFIAELAQRCMKHIGLESLDDVEKAAKNSVAT